MRIDEFDRWCARVVLLAVVLAGSLLGTIGLGFALVVLLTGGEL